MVTGFNHSGLVVADIDLMVTFYRDELGLSVIREVDSVAPPTGDHTGFPGARRKLVFVGKSGNDHMLELVHYIDPLSPKGHLERNQLGASHICFNVNDLTTLHKKLARKGIHFVTDPIFKTAEDGSKVGICYIKDPEGNWVELIEHI